MKLLSESRVHLLLTITLLCFSSSLASSFGKNSVNYTYFKWKYLSTEHFDVYYNQDGRDIADFAAEVAEEAYQELTQKFQYFPGNKIDPIVIVTYKSHNDFSQTNLSGAPPDEATGGFTEFLKNRVVIPFEGDHEKFRHVIHHELTHAIFMYMLFGQGFGAVVSGMTQARIPLWFIEGLAEYESRGGLDEETEAILRDALVNDNLPEINQLDYLGYFGVYKAGQSILYWIAHRYGDEKIGEILHQIKDLRDFNRAIKAALGFDQKELSKRWRRWVQERYWPQIIKMDQIEKVAEQLTDHIKEFCYINNSPAISPNGEWIAFLSERSDYFDVYLMSTIDGKVHKRLIKGQRSGNFEELHWLRPGITWAPDGKSIALCAKTGKNDALFIVDVESTKVLQMLEFESDGMFSPSWSPDSNKIALVFVKNGKSDLAYVDINTGNLSMITSDIFDDADPSWSSDSRRLLFTSNRNNKSESTSGVPDHRFTDYNYQRFNIFEINIFDKNIKQITDDDYLERTPIWSQNEQEILFISNKNRVYNIYSFNVNTGNSKPISNFVTGALQPSISKQTQAICFSSYFNMGYDIFLINEPLDNNTFAIPLEVPDPGKIEQNQSEELGFGNLEVDYSHFVFISEDDLKQQNADDFPDSSQVIKRTKDENGSYTSNDYEVSFSPDIVFVNAAYSPYYNMQGSGMILFTDVLGNHQLYLSLDLNRYVEWSNIYVNYGYQARRVSVSTGAYHYAYLYSGDHVYWQDQNIGLFVSLGYPLSRFNRIDFGVSYLSIIRGVYDWDNLYHANKPGISELQAVLPHIAYVHDTSVWKSSIEPANGGRWRFDVTGSPGIAGTDGNRLEFITFSADWRQYFRYKRDYSFAIRLSGAASEGKNPQRFYMGGVLNWFNPRWDNLQSSAEINDINDIYFASWVTPIRGVGYYNQVGSKYLLSNIEFRFPFIRYLVLGWPLPAFFQNVRGAIFTDVGTAWTSSNLMNNSWTRGSGFGIRLDLGIFPLQWDVAWSPDPSSNMGPRYYFSINTGF